MWNVAKYSLKPDTRNVHCFAMAREWKMRQGEPVESAWDKAIERKLERRVSLKPSGQKQSASQSRW